MALNGYSHVFLSTPLRTNATVPITGHFRNWNRSARRSGELSEKRTKSARPRAPDEYICTEILTVWRGSIAGPPHVWVRCGPEGPVCFEWTTGATGGRDAALI